MSLPPGFLDELRTRLSLGQVVGRKVMWDTRKSNQAKGDLWAPCPFHQEKSASFHVDDRKGYYYCFGCHAKGDAISFVRETENVDFIEAVRILAGEAGMPMPERDPEAGRQADRRAGLAEVMEEALRFYRLQLRTAAAAEARAYLDRRGLSPEALARWDIGFAPQGWQALGDHLRQKGIPDDTLIEAGLAKRSDKGGRPYDVFRDRILFPIRDPRGRVIAFGGRAMDPNDGAKYLNSPETPLFDKSRTLYNHGPARTAAGKGQPLIVAEGYMDVIALAEHGFEAAVAPLGTAVTEHHLMQLWRIADEPVIALDGDTAGIRAAHRTLDLALPMLAPGKTLRFVLLPEGQDPDDLLRARGAPAMQELVDTARPLISLLWQRELEARPLDTPERRAAFDQALAGRTALIRDASVRRHYEDEIRRLRWDLFRSSPGKGARRRAAPPPPAKTSALAQGGLTEEALRETMILAILATTPDVMDEFAGDLEGLAFSDPGRADLAHALMSGAAPGDMRDRLAGHPQIAISPAIRRPGDLETARLCLAEELAKLAAGRGHAMEVAEAEADLAGEGAGEYLTRRLALSGLARDRAGRSGVARDRTDFERAANGALVDRGERARFAALLTEIGFEKPGGETN
jgi:DNA primase